MKLNLDPKPNSITLMLQVTRSVIIETYDPNPLDPAATAAKATPEVLANAQKEVQKEAAKAAEAAKKEAAKAPVSQTQNPVVPAQQPPGSEDSEDDTNDKIPPVLSPVEQPPKFDRR